MELGKKCEGAPSVCTDAECGNGIVEGAESCDDGNDVAVRRLFVALPERTELRRRVVHVRVRRRPLINEECDDGNTTDGDGCSSTCTKETGFTCEQTAICEKINGECVLRVPAIFRDFSDNDPDFGWPVYPDTTCGIPEGEPDRSRHRTETGSTPKGAPCSAERPRMRASQSADTFARWFRDGAEHGPGRRQPRALRQRRRAAT